MGTFLVWAAAWDHVAVQGLCRTGRALHGLPHSGELAPSLSSGSTQESSPPPGQHGIELALVSG